MEGWFGLQSAADLLAKLGRDFDKLKQNPVDVDLAYNFFVTAEHMLDWQYPGYALGQKRTEEKEGEYLLRVTSHIANGLKHFRPEAKQHKLVKQTGQMSHWDERHFPAGHFHPSHWFQALFVELDERDGRAAQELGRRITVLDLAQRVLDLWRQRLPNAT